MSDETVRVVTITLDGVGFTDDNVDNAVEELRNAMEDRSHCTYTVRFHEMARSEFDGLPEFEGF